LGVIFFSALHDNLYPDSYSDPSNSEWGVDRIFWAISFVVATLYTFTWDYFMDWGLGQWGSKNFPLRDELFYARHKWFYYYAIVSNFIFRFFWTVTITKGLPVFIGVNPMALAWIAATVEIVRRFTWSILRIENEYLGKSDTQYRDSNFIPLPFEVQQVQSDRLQAGYNSSVELPSDIEKEKEDVPREGEEGDGDEHTVNTNVRWRGNSVSINNA